MIWIHGFVLAWYVNLKDERNSLVQTFRRGDGDAQFEKIFRIICPQREYLSIQRNLFLVNFCSCVCLCVWWSWRESRKITLPFWTRFSASDFFFEDWRFPKGFESPAFFFVPRPRPLPRPLFFTTMPDILSVFSLFWVPKILFLWLCVENLRKISVSADSIRSKKKIPFLWKRKPDFRREFRDHSIHPCRFDSHFFL